MPCLQAHIARLIECAYIIIAEITPNHVIILADHARRTDDIEVDVVERTRGKAVASRDELPEGDGRRAYYENKIAWCDLLLRHAPKE